AGREAQRAIAAVAGALPVHRRSARARHDGGDRAGEEPPRRHAGRGSHQGGGTGGGPSRPDSAVVGALLGRDPHPRAVDDPGSAARGRIDAAGAVAGRGAGRHQRGRIAKGARLARRAPTPHGSRGLNGANTPLLLNSNSQACSVQSLKSWFASHWSAKPKKPSGACLESANGTAYSTATSLRGPPQGSSAYTSSSGRVGSNLPSTSESFM